MPVALHAAPDHRAVEHVELIKRAGAPASRQILRCGTASRAVQNSGGLSHRTTHLECAPGAGQIALSELTGHAGLPEDGSHGQTPYLQRRVQAPGRAGIHRRRKLARTWRSGTTCRAT